MCLFFRQFFFRWFVIFKSLNDFLAPYIFLWIIFVPPMFALLMRFTHLSSYYPPSHASSPPYPRQILFALSETYEKARPRQGEFDPSICGWHAFHILSSLNHTSDITLSNSLCRRHLIFMFHYPATPKRRITVTVFLCHLQFLMCQRRYSCCYPCRLWHHVSCRLLPACRYGVTL